MSPWTDLTSTGESFTSKKDVDPVLNPGYLERMIHAYARGEDLTNPFVSPLFGDFRGFPPTYVQVGENEMLLSDATRLVDRLKEAGVVAKLDVFENMWHVFQMSPFKTAYEAMDKNVAFIIDDLMHF